MQAEKILFMYLIKGWFSHSWSRKSAYDLVKIKNQSHKWSHKLNGIRVRRIRIFQLSELEAVAKVPPNHKTWNQAVWLVYYSTSAFDSENLVLTIKITSNRVISRISVLLHSDGLIFTSKIIPFYGFDYDSNHDSITSENQLQRIFTILTRIFKDLDQIFIQSSCQNFCYLYILEDPCQDLCKMFSESLKDPYLQSWSKYGFSKKPVL